jgi:hypothetical protein
MRAGDICAMPADIRHRAIRPSARCCWSGKTPRRTCRSATKAVSSSRTRSNSKTSCLARHRPGPGTQPSSQTLLS